MTAATKPELKRQAIVLCVEDEQELLHDIAEELTEAGYVALQAASGDAALACMQQTRPDLILCDISMPGMDGFELLEAVQAMEPGHADIPFVFLTALSGPREVVDGKRLGADDYLIKPIDYDLLLATVEARLRQIERIRRAQRAAAALVDTDALATRFQLTPAEARVAAALAEGKQPARIAREFDVSRTTIAFHIRNIFAKTDTRRQAELVSLLLRPEA